MIRGVVNARIEAVVRLKVRESKTGTCKFDFLPVRRPQPPGGQPSLATWLSSLAHPILTRWPTKLGHLVNWRRVWA